MGDLGAIYNCHCSKCRHWHGAAFRTRAAIHSSQFKWLRGENLLSRFHSSERVQKHFCRVCGSSLISTYDDHPERIGVPALGMKSLTACLNTTLGQTLPKECSTTDVTMRKESL